LRGRVAAYAWGEDYHEILADRLRRLVAFIEATTGAAVLNRWYSDTGPVLERDLAQRAGLGWIGKNTCLIHPTQGSYFLLAEILLAIELEPDPPFPHDRCGSCTRCLVACPTGCILPDRTIDARRCISYLTIELKGAIPSELRSQMGDWVFGCDICQQVCPWNLRFASGHGDPAFAQRPGVPCPDLLAELKLSPEQFNLKFKRSSVKRAKRRGYLRNIAIALGNLGDATAIPALAETMASELEPLVRMHAAWALGRLGGEAARRALQHAAQIESDEAVLSEIQTALDSAIPAPSPID
jgi:epoxyqueuosine reductase